MSETNHDHPDLKNYKDWFSEHNIPLPDFGMEEKLYYFLDLVWEWNLKVNLTASSSKLEVFERHILDSLVLNHFRKLFSGSIVDLGSGGGFPSIPMAICNPDNKFFLIERVARKCAFLNAAKRKLGLKNVSVLNNDLSQVNSFDLSLTCFSRAVRVDKKVVLQLKERGVVSMILHKSERENFTRMIYRLPGETRDRYVSVIDL